MKSHYSLGYANVTKFQDANHLVYAIYACPLWVESRHSLMTTKCNVVLAPLSFPQFWRKNFLEREGFLLKDNRHAEFLSAS